MDAEYLWNGQREFILRFGEETAPKILFVQPFFEEANRVRHMIVNIMRHLAANGFSTALPDLPGTGESLVSLDQVSFADWQGALAAAAQALGNPQMVVSFRTGSLVDHAADAAHIWRCAPETGARLVRDLMRTQLTGAAAEQHGDTVLLAGNRLRQTLIEDLKAAAPLPHQSLRVARLATDATDADVRLGGGPLWRRSEPGDDLLLQDAIVSSLMTWAKSCVAA
jgi:pimeloyl-ACP methyl ester carboxylesterase